MSRILELQRLPTSSTSPIDSDLDGNSTSSGNGCACSTKSAGLCYMDDGFVAV
ncbi:hypothetical protein J5226_06060 [Lysobacter sp. K5869]|uniref:hypothetical protein n=1 Tax=Lysobacter sp. K5869 TaxID=2820808 RepID=UPI001C0614B7|nr:hypothetical protein [Lysobacter sp. K5869]QWP77968.1 hypothetical protein J5226_06060 [Lysobacter sp. K5869]